MGSTGAGMQTPGGGCHTSLPKPHCPAELPEVSYSGNLCVKTKEACE